MIERIAEIMANFKLLGNGLHFHFIKRQPPTTDNIKMQMWIL